MYKMLGKGSGEIYITGEGEETIAMIDFTTLWEAKFHSKEHTAASLQFQNMATYDDMRLQI